MKIAAFDERYFVGTLGRLDQCDESSITEIYDLQADPLQLRNIPLAEADAEAVERLFACIVARKAEIAASSKG